MMMVTRVNLGCALMFAVVATACDRSPLVAPTNSAVTVTVASSFVPTGGTTEVTAWVSESSGTPVQNGTVVRFTTNLGRMDPVEAQTKNGYAVATFVAGESSGIADVRATSGSAGNGTSDAETAATNVVRITVGAAAVETVVLGANPTSVPPGGGTVTLLATVTSVDGRALPGIPVTFLTSAGQLGSQTALTDASGQARTTLTTDREAVVKAQAGAKTSADFTVTATTPVTVALTATGATPVTGTGQQWTFTATTSPTTSGAPLPISYEWEFGDGNSATTNSSSTSHVYTSGPNQVRVVTVRIRLSNGQVVTASTEILLGNW